MKYINEYLRTFRFQTDNSGNTIIACPRCGNKDTKLLSNDSVLDLYVCYDQRCSIVWKEREDRVHAVKFPKQVAREEKISKREKKKSKTGHYQFTPISMTLLDRSRNLEAYFHAVDLIMERGLNIVRDVDIQKHCGVESSTAERIKRRVYTAMQPQIISPQTAHRWYINATDDAKHQRIDKNIKVFVALEQKIVGTRDAYTHWSKIAKSPEEAEGKRNKIPSDFESVNIRFAYYTQDDNFNGFLSTYFYRSRYGKFAVLAPKNEFRYSNWPEKSPTGYSSFSFLRYKRKESSTKFKDMIKSLEEETDRMLQHWKKLNKRPVDFGYFLCAYMYIRNKQFSGVTVDGNDIYRNLLLPKTAKEINLRLTLPPGKGAPPLEL